MIEEVAFGGEREGLRIDHPHVVKVRPRIAGVLDVRRVGDVRRFVEAGRYVGPRRADEAHEHEHADQQRGDQEIGCRRRRPGAGNSVFCGGGHTIEMRGEGLNFRQARP